MKRIGILLVSWTATYRFLMASDPWGSVSRREGRLGSG